MAKKISQAVEWARLMAHLQARACIISRVTGMSAADSRRLWHNEIGRSSPSGQQPNDFDWFLKSGTRRIHAAMILQLYAIAEKSLPSYAALTHAYYHYARMTAGMADRESWTTDPAFRRSEEDYVIPFSRAHFLSQIYTDDELENGKRKCPLQVRRCKSCGTLYLGHVEETSKKCPICSSKKNAIS